MMKLALAIALSSGNKAQAKNDLGERIIVQGRYASPVSNTWLHVWTVRGNGTIYESDFPQERVFLANFKATYQVDPEEEVWEPI